MNKLYALCIIAALSACSRGAVVVDRPTTVSVPVSVPCVSGTRPEPLVPLRDVHPDWKDYSPKQKAELVAARALAHQSHADALNAATSACK